MAEEDEEQTTLERVMAITSQVVLFLLIFGFAATIHYKSFFRALKSRGIFIGLFLQMIIMPLFGFALFNIVPDLTDTMKVVFMILLSSPGGSLSNFFNSIFNGDLSLSIAMTTVSTIVALPFLPLNLYLYLHLFSSGNGSSATSDLDWGILGKTCAILVVGVTGGLYANYKVPQHVHKMYRVANICALVQIVMAFVTSNNDSPIWEKPPQIFAMVAITSGSSLLLSLAVALAFKLPKPQVYAVVVEVCIQNSSVAVSFCFAAFSGTELSEGLAIPVSFGVSTFVYCLIFTFFAHRAGWTYTPKDVSCWQGCVGFYQPHPEDFESETDELVNAAKVEDIEDVKKEIEIAGAASASPDVQVIEVEKEDDGSDDL